MSDAIGISVCSYSFHRMLQQGRQDIFSYITTCKELGCTELDPWNGHMPTLRNNAPRVEGSSDLKALARLSSDEEQLVRRIKQAGDQVGLPFGTIAIDGAHIYDPDPEKRKALRANAYRWLNICGLLGARRARIDAGGDEKLPDDMFNIIVEGYHDLIAYARNQGVELLIENHWGSSKIPANVERILSAVNGLGLLFDTFNWASHLKAEGWKNCAKYARALHLKTFAFDDEGNEITENLPWIIRRLQQTGYAGPWGVESVPADGDEIAGARKTIDLIRRLVPVA